MMGRLGRYVARFVIDAAIAGMGLFLAYLTRYDGVIPQQQQRQLLIWIGLLITGRILTQFAFGINKHKWRYLTFGDAVRILEAYASFSLLLLGFSLFLPEQGVRGLYRLPVSVIATEFMFTLCGTIAVRAWWRFIERRTSSEPDGGVYRKILIVGAGIHAIAVAEELARRRGVRVLGFVDDDSQKKGAVLSGIPVLGPISSLEQHIGRHKVDEVLICLPPAEQKKLKLRLPKDDLVRTRVVPSLDEILSVDAGVLEFDKGSAPAIVSRANGKPTLVSDYPRTTLRDKTIVITGGAGFIGSHLASKLADHNRVILLDLAVRNKPIEFTGLLNHPNVEAVEGSLLNGIDLKALCQDADMVVHTAAVVGVNRVCNSGRDTLQTNYEGTSRLLQAVDGSKNLKRFIYFSTSEIFGINSFRVDENSPSSIGPIAESRWSYAIAKLAGEHLIKAYFRETGMPVVIVRPFNIFGPMRTGDHAMLRFILDSLRGGPVQVHGDGSQIRSWCYIDDFCAALLLMLERYEAVGEDFNIGNGCNVLTIHELARKVVELCGGEAPIEFVEHPFPDISIRVPSIAKAQTLLGYKPRYDLNSALRLTVDWYRENLEFFTTEANTLAVVPKGNASRPPHRSRDRKAEAMKAAANYSSS
jgi:nucleoside-diphosphate-sugar epimerase